MKLVLLAAAAVAWILWRRRRAGGSHVVVAWQDGSELELRAGSPEHDRLASVAGRAFT